jgi:hypothetical protein
MAYTTECNFKIGDFYELEQKYLTVKPIRGKNDIRPLESRSKQHLRVVKIDDDTYACRLYQTDVATYHRDGRVVMSLGGYNTMSTRAFFAHTIPHGYYFMYHKQTISIAKMPDHYIDKHTYHMLDTGGSITINTVTEEITGGLQPTKQVVNRKKSKEARAQYKPFLDWAKSYMVTLGIEVPRETSMTYALEKQFIANPESITEDRYLDVLSSLVYQKWYAPKLYEAVKNQLFKEGTHYDIINLPAGTLHQG